MRVRRSDGRQDGSITVFLSLLLALFLSFFLSLTDAAGVQCSKSMAREISLLSIDSAFGEYQKELFEQYGVFGLDTGYRKGGYSEEAFLDHYCDYLSYQTEAPEGGFFAGSAVPMKPEQISTELTAAELLTDDGGRPFREQISDVMQQNYGLEAAQDILDLDEEIATIREMELQWGTVSSQNDAAMQQADIEEGGEQSAPSESEGESASTDLLQTDKELRAVSVLNLLFEHPEELSNKSLNTESLASHRTLAVGFGEQDWKKERNEWMDTVLFREYLLSECGNLLSEDEIENSLQYEAEYVLYGKDSDIANLEALSLRLLLVREAVNFAYLCTDQGKLAEAEAAAVTISAALLIPEFAEVFKWALVLSWALGESVLDLRTLYAGGKVPLWKTEATWDIGLLELPTLLSGPFRTRRKQDEGIDYKNTLRILLYLGSTDTQTLRTLDLAEVKVRNAEGTPKFYADACFVGAKIQNQWQTGGVTYTFPVRYAYR